VVSTVPLRILYSSAHHSYTETHCFLFTHADAWPETEEAAAVAVAESRAARAAAGDDVLMDEDTWNRHEYLIATKARIPVIKGIALSFKLGILKIGRLLWPPTEFLAELQHAGANTSTDTFEPEVLAAATSSQGDAPNATTDQTRALLKAIPGRINVLLDSAGRTGAQTALQTVLSWYPTVELSRLYAVREEATAMLQKAYADVHRLACTMVDWFSVYQYTPYLDDDGRPLAASSMAALAADSSSIRPYETAAPQPARSSSGYMHHDSDLSDSGSSHRSPKSKRARGSTSAGQDLPTAGDEPAAASAPPPAPTL